MSWGVFNDEGLMEGPFYSHEEALRAAAGYPKDEGATVEELCHDHPEQAASGCCDCYADED